MNRQTKTLLPTTRELSKPRSVVPDTEVTALRKHQEKQAQHYNKSAKELEPLATGDVVRMKPFVAGKKTWEKAMVKERVDERSYVECVTCFVEFMNHKGCRVKKQKSMCSEFSNKYNLVFN